MRGTRSSVAKPSARDKILEAGLKVFHAQGFNGCSVQDITETAGVPKGSFYNHFDSKEALAVEVLGVYEGSGDRSLILDRDKAPLDRLRDYFEGAARAFKEAGFKQGCLMGNLASELSDSSERVREALARRFTLWHGAVADTLREAQARGDMDAAIDADRMARFLVNSWEGALIQMKVSKSSQPIDDFLSMAFVSLHPR